MAKPTLIVAGESFSSDRRSVARQEAQPLDFRPALGAAREVTSLGEELQRLDDAQSLAQAQQQATEEMDLLQRELREAGGAALAQDEFLKRSAEIENRAISSLGGERLRERFGTIWSDLYHGHRLKVIDQAFSKGVDASRALFRTTAGQLADAAADEDDPRLAGNWLRQIDKGAEDLVRDGVISASDGVAERQAFHRRAATRTAERWIERDPEAAHAALEGGDPRLAALPDEDRADYIAEARSTASVRRVDAEIATRETQADMRRRVRANLDAVDGTGVDGDARLNVDEVRSVLGDDVAKEWRTARRQAKDAYFARSRMNKLDGAALEKYVSDHAGKLDFDVEDWAGRVLKDRAADPAGAADRAFGGASIDFDGGPEAIGETVSRRLRDQETIGIDGASRRVLTNAEAIELQRRLTLKQAEGPDGMLGGLKELDRMFGVRAEDALRDVLLTSSGDRDLARVGAIMGRKVGLGMQPSMADARVAQTIGSAGAAERAFAAGARPTDSAAWVPGSGQQATQGEWRARGNPPTQRGIVPNHAQIQMLMNRPDLAGQFEQKFGAGAARFYLDQRQVPSDSFHQDDGTVTIAPDGSESWTPDGAGAGPKYLEGKNGSVIRVDADGSETMLVPPKGAPVLAPSDPAAHQRMLQEYQLQKGIR